MRNMHQSTVFLTGFSTLGSTGPAKGGHEGESWSQFLHTFTTHSTKWVFSKDAINPIKFWLIS